MNQNRSDEMIVELTPLEKVELLYKELQAWYGEAEKKEVRIAAKFLIVALDTFSRHGGSDWHDLVMEYVDMCQNDPDKFRKIIESNRGELKDKASDLLH